MKDPITLQPEAYNLVATRPELLPVLIFLNDVADRPCTEPDGDMVTCREDSNHFALWGIEGLCDSCRAQYIVITLNQQTSPTQP